MEALRMSQCLLVAGGSGWTTSAEIRGEGGARSWGSGVLHLRAPSGTQHGGGFSTIYHRRRGATALVPAFPRPSSPFPAFPSAEKPKKADADQTETSEVHTDTASDLPKAAVEDSKDAPQIPNQTEESESSPRSAVKTEKSGAVQSQTPIETLEAAGAEVGSTQAKFHSSGDSEPLPASASETAAVQVGTQTSTELSSDLPSAEAADTAQVETQKDVPKTVRVRFILHKPCEFGEQFLLVGEDVALGVWEPANAIPLEWSEGHVWATEVDLPVGEEMKYKFILRGQTGKIKWQPGPNRVVQTSESTDAIVVAGEWETAVDQEVTDEKEQVAMAAEESIGEGSDSSTGVDGEAVTESGQAAVAESTVGGAADEKTSVQKERDAVLISGLASVPISSSPATEG